jgi:hypothetical protein
VSSHFNVKSLSFYAIAIGSVLLLFNVVTAYGESKLKAPKTIGGRYQLSFANSLPGCPQIAPLMLQLDQSGTYVNAAILKKEVLNSMSAEEKLTLTGLFKEQQLSLAGNVAQSVLCGSPQQSGESAIAITSKVDGDKLVGEIVINRESTKTTFTAEKAAIPSASPSSSH